MIAGEHSIHFFFKQKIQNAAFVSFLRKNLKSVFLPSFGSNQLVQIIEALYFPKKPTN